MKAFLLIDICYADMVHKYKVNLYQIKTIAMKTLLSAKQTEEQKSSNEVIQFQFVLALMNMDEKMIAPFLKKDSKFMGTMNDWQFLHWLRKQFSKLQSKGIDTRFKQGISLDFYPGSEMLEFSYAPMQEVDESFNFFASYEEQNPISHKPEMVLRFVLLIEDGKIADIRRCRKYALPENAKKLQIDN